MNSSTIGKYIPGNSFIHRLDPRVKLVANIVLIVLVFLARQFVTLGIILSVILITFMLTGLKKNQPFKMLKPIIFIGSFLFLINIFIMKGEGSTVYASWESLTISYAAIKQTLLIMTRIYVMIMVTTILTATTKPVGLTKAIEDLLLPLKLIKVPVHIISMIISIALRFIPTLMDEATRIMKAQASRGVDFKNGNLKSKAKSMVTLIIPLFVSAFAKAEDLGNAMETRGYDPYAKRTRYRAYPVKWIDGLASIIIIGLIAMLALINRDVIFVPFWWY